MGELVFGVVAVKDVDQNPVPGAGQTEYWDLFTGTEANGGGSTKAGAASVAMSWSWSADTDWAIGGVSIKPASATPTVRFNAASSSGLESVTSVTIPVSLSAASGQTVTVDYAVTGGTAMGGGVDYTLASGTLIFSAGQSTKTIPIAIVNDALNEANETIQVTLSNPSNAALGSNTVHTYTCVVYQM